MARQIINLGAVPGDKNGDKAHVGGKKINENFEEIYGYIDILTRLDTIIEAKGFSLVGRDLTVNAAWEWYIDNVLYTNILAVLFEDIPFSETGKSRMVYVVPNDENGFTIIDGEETTGTPPTPYLPNGGMYVTYFEVTDSSIGAPADPNSGDGFNNKLDKGGYVGTAQDLNLRISAVEGPINARSYIEKYTIAYQPLTLDGEISELYMSSQRNALSFNGTMTILNSLLFADFISTSLYPGCDFYIRNNQLTSFIVPHKSVETTLHVFPFSFPSGKDLTVNPGEIIHFKLNRTSGDEGYFEFVGIDINGINSNLMHLDGDEEVDGNKTFLEPVTGVEAVEPEHLVPLSQMEAANAQILSDANDYTDTGLALKLNAADYNDRYKGTYLTEAALNAAHPTASAGDSAQVNEVGSTVVVNYSWDAEDNVWVNNGSGGSGATNTDALPEGSSNLYWTTARGLALVLTGLSLVTGGAIVSTDSVLVAFGKIQKQINDLTTANIPDSANKRYVTDAQLTVIGNTSGTNSGNETATTLGALIGGAADATPNDSDFVATSLTAGGVLRKITWTNVKAFLQTTFDARYLVPQITITTSVSITTATNDASGFGQKGRHVVIDNSINAINITVNGGTGFCASYLKHGTGAITFVQGSGRTLAQVDGTAVLNGSVGSTATISSVGTKDYLRISNV